MHNLQLKRYNISCIIFKMLRNSEQKEKCIRFTTMFIIIFFYTLFRVERVYKLYDRNHFSVGFRTNTTEILSNIKK